MKRTLILLMALWCTIGSVDAKEKIKLACFGNSITEGSGVYDRITDSYPGVLQSMFGSDYEVRNFGIGAHTLMMRSDRPLMRTDLFRRALEWNPDIVTIKLGTNDSKRQNERFIDTDFVHDLTFMIDLLQQLPSHPKVYLCTPVPATAVQYNIHDSIIVNKEIPLIRKVAADRGIEIIDLYTALKPYGDLFPDHIHPNEAGAVKIAETIYAAITGVVKEYSRPQYPGVKSEIDGFTAYSFPYWGRDVTVVMSKVSGDKNNPW
ncbi:MAG: SGNH/GDSL hydrolase family protein, partial [Muribaculaceae bacterium]|nr:SGNH/GDSL hydrolase family protein [Muribaculaceae bacterium]